MSMKEIENDLVALNACKKLKYLYQLWLSEIGQRRCPGRYGHSCGVVVNLYLCPNVVVILLSSLE